MTHINMDGPNLVRWKRQSDSGQPVAIPAGQPGFKAEFDKDVNYVASKMGVQTWHVIFFVVVLVLAVIGLCAWCVVRFFRKKRRGKDQKDADLAADEAVSYTHLTLPTTPYV